MKRLIAFLDKCVKYFIDICKTLPVLAREEGCSTVRMAYYFVRCFLVNRSNLDDFRAMRHFETSPLIWRHFLTPWRKEKLKKRYLNVGCTPDDLRNFDDKHRFLELFRDFIHRDWLYVPDHSDEEIRAFLARNETFLLKPDDGILGQGILLCRREELDPDGFLEKYRGQKVLLEAYIRQHPDMAALNPTSVNTVRIVTVRCNGKVMIVGAGLRCGGKDAYLDNFHQGGSAYPIDLDTGIITGRGRDVLGHAIYLRHPATGHIMPGFQIPHWETLKKTVCQAALLPPHVGYVGWDVAVTEQGVDFVEGNAYAGVNIIQLDSPDGYKRMMDFIRAAS